MPTLSQFDPSVLRERRAWVRFGCELKGNCQPITQLEAGNRWPAQVWDVSNGGVGLRLSRRFEPGTLLAIDLAAGPDDICTLPLSRVRRVTAQGNYWLLGCSWPDELSADDLRGLLEPSANRAPELAGTVEAVPACVKS
jgi:hypothetical protein